MGKMWQGGRDEGGVDICRNSTQTVAIKRGTEYYYVRTYCTYS